MAYAYNDDGNYVSVPTLAGNNSFSGVQRFIGNVASTSQTTGTVVVTGGIGVQGNLYASKVWGCVWNDLVDCIEVPDNTELECGRAYYFDGKGYHKTKNSRCKGYIGIHSDTAGFYMGKQDKKTQLNVAVAGFVLAYVDRDYKPGTPLIYGKNGSLTKASKFDILLNPHKIVATYWKNELNEEWGSDDKKVKVNGRKWVKII